MVPICEGNNPEKDALTFYPEAGAMMGWCRRETWGAWVDGAGGLNEQPYFLGLPGPELEGGPDLFRTIAGKAWLGQTVFERATKSWRVTFAAHDGRGWRHLEASTIRAGGELVGLGAWPGGAVIAAFRDERDVSPPRLRVLEGTPSAPLPRFPPNIGAQFDLQTTEWGEAFASWELGRMDGGMVLLHWGRGTVDPRIEVLEGVRTPWHRHHSRFLVRSETEAYITVGHAAPGRGEAFARVLRFDGKQWRTSTTFSERVGVPGLTLTPDGAVWLVIESRGTGLGGSRSEIWRRRPGEGDQWDRIAPDDFDASGALRATHVMPAGKGDVLVAGELVGTGLGVYRIHLEASP